MICNAPILISLQGICTFVLVKQETDTSDPVWTVIEVDDLADSPYVDDLADSPIGGFPADSPIVVSRSEHKTYYARSILSY